MHWCSYPSDAIRPGFSRKRPVVVISRKSRLHGVATSAGCSTTCRTHGIASGHTGEAASGRLIIFGLDTRAPSLPYDGRMAGGALGRRDGFGDETMTQIPWRRNMGPSRQGNRTRHGLCGFAVLFLGACASTETTRLSQDAVRIDASAAPACGAHGARRLVARMAAIETIRLGYDSYHIAGMNAQSNVRTVSVNHHTTGTFNPYTGTYSGYTTSTPVTGGTHDADVVAVMFRSGDPGAANAIDARTALGPDWREIVAKGSPNTCLSR